MEWYSSLKPLFISILEMWNGDGGSVMRSRAVPLGAYQLGFVRIVWPLNFCMARTCGFLFWPQCALSTSTGHLSPGSMDLIQKQPGSQAFWFQTQLCWYDTVEAGQVLSPARRQSTLSKNLKERFPSALGSGKMEAPGFNCII